MKKISSLALLLFMFSTIILTSCNGSKKGKWSEADKKKFYSEARKELIIDYIDGKNDKSDFAEEMEECVFKKCEETYSSYDEMYKEKGNKKFTKICDKCVSDIFDKNIEKQARKDREYNEKYGSSEVEDAPLPESTEKEDEELEDY